MGEGKLVFSPMLTFTQQELRRRPLGQHPRVLWQERREGAHPPLLAGAWKSHHPTPCPPACPRAGEPLTRSFSISLVSGSTSMISWSRAET